MNEIEKLYETLRKLQEPKGYYFNRDKAKALEVIEALVANRGRYGYMCCPCRLASGDREADRDMICPCEYREADVKEYGTCFCNLYSSREWNEGKIPHIYVPDRRPPEKVRF